MPWKIALGMIFSLVPVALFARSDAPQTSATAQSSAIAEDEYAVYAAVIDSFQAAKKSSHPIVADRTATFQCQAKCNGLEIGGCNGLRHENETPAQRLAIVQRDLPQLNPSAVTDFDRNNQSCATLAKKIPAKTKYLMSLHEGDSLPDDWDSPDYFFFSRVGFNADHTQALVVLGFLSGTQARDSMGKYFLLVKQTGRWHFQGSSLIWQLQPQH
jgi:hypothetical protein